MDRWQAMRIFVKVAETESFAETARQMHMSVPAVTRSVAALEELIGARLFVRTTRSVKMTEAGAQYLEDCRRILSDIAEAGLSARQRHHPYARPGSTSGQRPGGDQRARHTISWPLLAVSGRPASAANTVFSDWRLFLNQRLHLLKGCRVELVPGHFQITLS